MVTMLIIKFDIKRTSVKTFFPVRAIFQKLYILELAKSTIRWDFLYTCLLIKKMPNHT